VSAIDLTVSIPSLGTFGETRGVLAECGLGPRLKTVEILWDNYVSLDPARLRDDLATLADEVMIHTMWSRFLEIDDEAFSDYLRRFRHHVDFLQPTAVSDHLCRFMFDGLFVAAGQEIAYDRLDFVCERVARYQDAIGQQLRVENTASVEHPVQRQVAFLDELIQRTGCGLLFDISNAVVGELNGCGAVTEWLPLISGRDLRCHVGSYSYDEEVDCYLDSHDGEVSVATTRAIPVVLAAAKIASVTYERDFNRSVGAMARDVDQLRGLL
jgi:uncharacterized protein (UPF0276 family)